MSSRLTSAGPLALVAFLVGCARDEAPTGAEAMSQTCVAGGCLGDTTFAGATPGNCEAGYGETANLTCDQAVPPAEGPYRCCCTQ